MAIRSATQRSPLWAALFGVFALIACGDDDPKPNDNPAAPPTTTGNNPASTPPAAASARHVLASIVLDPSDPSSRTTYLQAIPSLDAGPFSSKRGIEIKGNAALISGGGAVFVAYAEEPVWERFELDATGQLKSIARLSLQQIGANATGYSHAYVDAETAVTILTEQLIAVLWNPTTMQITGEIDLAHLKRDGYDLEAWPVSVHQGRVYVPARWQDWMAKKQVPGTSLTILDPKAKTVVAVAEDARCTSGGSPVFASDGHGYVMADGRTWSDKTFALSNKEPPPPDHCILRLPPGGTAFDPAYSVSVPSLTGGPDSISTLTQATPGTDVGFARVFDPSKLPADLLPDSYAFWQKKAHRMYAFTLGAAPKATPVAGLDYSTVGFTPVVMNGKVYVGESPDDTFTDVYEIDPATSAATNRFRVDGQFLGLFDLSK